MQHEYNFEFKSKTTVAQPNPISYFTEYIVKSYKVNGKFMQVESTADQVKITLARLIDNSQLLESLKSQARYCIMVSKNEDRHANNIPYNMIPCNDITKRICYFFQQEIVKEEEIQLRLWQQWTPRYQDEGDAEYTKTNIVYIYKFIGEPIVTTETSTAAGKPRAFISTNERVVIGNQNRIVYKQKGDRKKYIKHKGSFITVSAMRKLIKSK